MGDFGDVAVQAAELVGTGKCKSVLAAWSEAAQAAFAHSASQQGKGCSRNAFLVLALEPTLANSKQALWSQALDGADKKHNGQMDVVLALHGKGLLVCPAS